MSAPGQPAAGAAWDSDNDQLVTVARNVGTRYVVIATDAVIGLVLLPINVHYLGQSMWGLWMLTASLNTYFSILDLGYGGSVTRFVALYRARRDAHGLNEILSTLLLLFAGIGLVAYVLFVALAFNVGSVFNLTPEQVDTARALLLISGVYVALGFPFAVFGGVTNGFQRCDINNVVGVGTSVVVAAVNITMLASGATLVQMVGATTAIRIGSYFVYRRNAYRLFPALTIRPSLFRWSRIREVTGFSVYIAVINWSHAFNYTADSLIIGAFMTPAAVALWTVPRRMAEFVMRLTNQLNSVLLPVVVDSDATERSDRLRTIFVQGTRLSLAAVLPIAVSLLLVVDSVIRGWVGSGFEASIPVGQIMMLVVALRVGNATANTILKGAGQHRFLAMTNICVAASNIALSLWWIQRYGLVGQALGTLVPLSVASIFVLWPAACRRVGIGTAKAFRKAVWPALWPLAPMMLVVLPLRSVLPSNLIGAALVGAAGSLCYAATFAAFAVSRHERAVYLGKVARLTRRGLPAAA